MNSLHRLLITGALLGSALSSSSVEASLLMSASFDGPQGAMIATTAGPGNYTPEVGTFSVVSNASNATLQSDPAGGVGNALQMIRTETVSPSITFSAKDGTPLSSGLHLNLSIDFYRGANGDGGGIIFYSSAVANPIAGFNVNTNTGILSLNHHGSSGITIGNGQWYQIEMDLRFNTISDGTVTGNYDVYLTSEGNARTRIADNIFIPAVSATSSLRLFFGVNSKVTGDKVATMYFRDVDLVAIPEGQTVGLLVFGAFCFLIVFRHRKSVAA